MTDIEKVGCSYCHEVSWGYLIHLDESKAKAHLRICNDCYYSSMPCCGAGYLMCGYFTCPHGRRFEAWFRPTHMEWLEHSNFRDLVRPFFRKITNFLRLPTRQNIKNHRLVPAE